MQHAHIDIIRVVNYSTDVTVIHCRFHVDCDGHWLSPRDGKEPLLMGFSSVRVLPNVMVWIDPSSSHVQEILVQFS